MKALGAAIFLIVALATTFPTFAKEEGNSGFKKEGIKIVYKADRDLNIYNGQSHTLVLVVYQLLNKNAFNSLRETEDGMLKLLEAGNFDMSVLSKRKVIVHPSDDEYFYVDRFPEANYVGLVTGYNMLDAQNSTSLIGLSDRKRNRFFWRQKDNENADIVLGVELGKEFIKKVSY